jgi:hypothetical protein
MFRIVLLALLCLAAWKAYETHHPRQAPSQSASTPFELPAKSESNLSFSCDGRKYCSQMTSCAEATYFLRNCPGVKMDGNNDGIPCAQQWCR